MRWTAADAAIFTAVTCAHLRDWAPAADLARQYAAGAFPGSDCEGVGWAHVTVGGAFLAADRPDPAAAAHAGLLALDATAGPDMSVLQRVTSLHARLGRWPGEAEVARLDAALTTARTALPASTRKAPPTSGHAKTTPPTPSYGPS